MTAWAHRLTLNLHTAWPQRYSAAQEIHMAYLEAGADILETNSFSGTVIAQVRVARRACCAAPRHAVRSGLHAGWSNCSAQLHRSARGV